MAEDMKIRLKKPSIRVIKFAKNKIPAAVMIFRLLITMYPVIGIYTVYAFIQNIIQKQGGFDWQKEGNAI